ncbi:AraC family transcriptional regulator ligand-binding domain-containing protein [Nonomuraea indica]|uniref:AraC family transcriptional regulator ligand-binding domain-containing protein n=1 Tax=Nonomuraea indica TaxID=1581193 RepID=UPI000C7DBF99|nr:AraC family transcriptional regulator ligand-binding domain-containing protein [Nonomuraea indica]
MNGTIAASAVRYLLAASEDPERLAREAGLSDHEFPSRVPADAVDELWARAATLNGDPQFGLTLGRSYRPGTFGLLDFLFLSSDTLADALGSAVRHVGVLSTGGSYGWSEHDGLVTLSRSLPTENGHAATFLLGWQLALVRVAAGKPITPVRIELAMPAPPRHGDLIEAYGPRAIDFGRQANSLTFRRSELEIPLVGADPVTAAMLRRRAAQLLPAERSWRDKVRAFQAEHLGDLDAAAAHFAISPRRLQELLKQEGTNWRRELETVRGDLAVELLSDGRLPTAVIARRLGYSDERAFRRAFRRTHGMSPRQYRRGA